MPNYNLHASHYVPQIRYQDGEGPCYNVNGPNATLAQQATGFGATSTNNVGEHYQDYIGKYCFHDSTNDNGLRLINPAASKKIIVGSTHCPRRKLHKTTWVSPDRITKNQIKHILIDRRHLTDLLDLEAI